ncbi:hypothetical protein E2C01_006771 [Portunus trituberculatus]|uniref:Uncharacterized protein n=1 Tax=Portunus trituberculatus TaxID=210409 RepID=A0A5B7CXN9_PORTR|nr:hypothetical protein [Portunus trituberculatus]
MTLLFLPPPPPPDSPSAFTALLFLPSHSRRSLTCPLSSHRPPLPLSRSIFRPPSSYSSYFSTTISSSSAASAASSSLSLPAHFLSGGRGERCKVRHTATGPSEVQHPRDEAKTGQATRPN